MRTFIPGKQPFLRTIIIKQNRKMNYANLEYNSTIIKIEIRQNFYFAQTTIAWTSN